MEKSFRISIVLTLLAALAIGSGFAPKSRISALKAVDDCYLTQAEILELQGKVAEEESLELSYVINHTINISYSECDGALATAGTITLDIDDLEYTWNWTIERGGGINILVIWPT